MTAIFLSFHPFEWRVITLKSVNLHLNRILMIPYDKGNALPCFFLRSWASLSLLFLFILSRKNWPLRLTLDKKWAEMSLSMSCVPWFPEYTWTFYTLNKGYAHSPWNIWQTRSDYYSQKKYAFFVSTHFCYPC